MSDLAVVAIDDFALSANLEIRVSNFPRSPAPAARSAVLWLAALAAAFLADWGSLELTRPPGQVAAIWPGDAVILALMLAGGRGALGRLVAGGLGGLLAELVWGDPPLQAAGMVLANLAGVLLMHRACRFGCGIDLRRTRHVLLFLGIAACASLLAGTLGGGIFAWATGGAFLPEAARWTLADFLGYAVIAPPVLVLQGRRPDALRPRWGARAGLVLLAYVAVAATVFAQTRYPLLFLIPLGLFAVAYWIELEGVMAAVLATVVLGSGFAMAGLGPGGLAGGGRAERLILLQAFLAANTVSFLPISAVLAEGRRLAHALCEAREAAEADAALKSEFLADISHELRTPLASILGFASILKQGGRLSEDDREHAESISVAGSALLAMVNDILAFSELEAGRLEVRPEPASIREIAAEAVRLVQAGAAAKGLTLALDIDSAVPADLGLDHGRVRQVLVNLLVNAVKFTESGAVWIIVAYDAAAKRLSVAVRDTGPGLDPDQLGRLFERFSRADPARRRRHGGAGLGLAICKGLIAAMGGTMEAESRLGQGTTVSFHIPAAPALGREAARPDVAATLRPRGRRLLLAGRIAPEADWARSVLAPLGLEISEAEGAEAAAALARDRAFDLIVVDEGLGGELLPLARAVREPGGASCHGLLILVGEGERDALRAAGFDGRVGKPISRDDLIGLVMSPQRHVARAGAVS